MKTILLSMQPYWFEKVYSGEKIYEYRNKFANEEVKAYIYVSKPVQAIKGILILGKRESLYEWREVYKNNVDVLKRINIYDKGKNRYAMQIKCVYHTSEISLAAIRKEFPEFIIPQSYYYIDNSDLLSHLNKSLVLEDVINSSFETISENEICRLYREE